MLELVMRAIDPRQTPAVRFQSLDELPAVHGGYYNHHEQKINAPSDNERLVTDI